MKRTRIRWYAFFLVSAAFAVLGVVAFVPIYAAPPGPKAGEDRAVPWLVPLTPSHPEEKQEDAHTAHNPEQSRQVLSSRSWAVDTVAYSVVCEESLAHDLRRLSDAVSAEPGVSMLVRQRISPHDLSEKGMSIYKASKEGALFDTEGTEPTPVIYVPDPAHMHQSTIDGVALSAPLAKLRTLPQPSAVATIFSVPPLFFHFERLNPPQSGLEYIRYIHKKRGGLTFYEIDWFQFRDRGGLEGWESTSRRINRLEQKLRPRTIWGGTIHARIKALSINPRLTMVQIDLLDRTGITDQFRYLALPFADALPLEDWLRGDFANGTSARLDVKSPALERHIADIDLWRIPHRGFDVRKQEDRISAWEAALLDIPESTPLPIGGPGPLRYQQRFALPDFASLLDPPVILIRWRDDAKPGAERYVVEHWQPGAARGPDLRMVILFANITDEALASFVAWAHAPP